MEGIVMKTIEERAKEWGEYIAERTPYDVIGAKYSYIAGANEQKEIDDAELLKLKAEWEINHDMKSIKERAKEYSKDHWNELTAKEAYIAGAKDQKAIDIDNAKSAFNKACGWLSTYTWYNEVVEEFRKAMDKQLND